MAIWKGDGPIRELGYFDAAYFGTPEQFAPVFTVAEIRNDGRSAAQVTNVIWALPTAPPNSSLIWKPATGAAFNAKAATIRNSTRGISAGALSITAGWFKHLAAMPGRSPEATTRLGSFDQIIGANIENGLRSSGVKIEKVKTGTFNSSSKAQAWACLARLNETGILGNLASYLYREQNNGRTNVAGTIQYDWQDNNKTTNHRISPFQVVVPLLYFDVGTGPECGAPGPVRREYGVRHSSQSQAVGGKHDVAQLAASF